MVLINERNYIAETPDGWWVVVVDGQEQGRYALEYTAATVYNQKMGEPSG